jgi:hypothetical protein
MRRSKRAAIRFKHLDKTDRGIRLTLPQTKGDHSGAVTVALPDGDTERCRCTRWNAGSRRRPVSPRARCSGASG